MHRVGLLISDHFQVLGLSTLSIFEFANQVTGERFYDCNVYSEFGGSVKSSSGFGVESQPIAVDIDVDTWLVAGVLTPLELPASPGIVDFLKAHVPRARRVAGICTGAFVLGQAGLLSERRATTHWVHAPSLKTLHPTTHVEEDRIFIIDGNVWTSAGLTAGLDMALGMVEKDLGAEVARTVAHLLVMHHRRSGGQTQHSEMLMLSPAVTACSLLLNMRVTISAKR